MVKKRKGTRKKPKHSNGLKIVLTTFVLLFLFLAVAASGVILAMIKTAPPLDINKVLNPSEPSVIYDDKEKSIDTVISDTHRTIVHYNDVPDNLKNAFVSIEDERFLNHHGVDFKRVFGATIKNVINKATGKPGIQGASTITQQLIKNTLLSHEIKIKRKVQEMYLAKKLEQKASKEQILEAYMNTIPLGGSAYGIEAASKQYFSKSVKDLSLIECAFIAGLPQSPSVFYNAAMSKKNTLSYINRSKTVLSKMHEHGYISDSDFQNAIASINNGDLVIHKSNINIDRLNYEWYSREVLKQVKKDLITEYNISTEEAQHMIIYGGLKIYSCMNKDLQDFTQDTLNNMNSILGIYSKNYNNILEPQASAVIMDYHTGQVKSLVGGRGKQPPLSFNRATEFYRAAGSSIKPLSVYGPAIDTKIATAATIFDDAPVPSEIGSRYVGSGEKPYNPKNSPDVFEGSMTLREALLKSKNVVAVRIEDQLGLKKGAEYAQKFGLKLNAADEGSIAAVSLGELSGVVGKSGTNTLTMAAAYGVFGNKGMLSKPILYTKVIDRLGKTVLENKYSSTKVMSPEGAYITYDLLKGPVSFESGATGSAANFGPMTRGKTGTSDGSRNLWFCGLSPYYSAAVWIGKDDNTRFNYGYGSEFGKYIGSSDAAKLWKVIMEEAHKNLEEKELDKPSGIVEQSICLDSGKLSTDSCPRDRVKTAYFIEGTEPSESCSYHYGFIKRFFKNPKNDDSKKDDSKKETEEKEKTDSVPNEDKNSLDKKEEPKGSINKIIKNLAPKKKHKK